MFRKYILSVAFIFCSFLSFAQADSSHLRVSLLTCGIGDEIWETFGHTAIRITDSAHGTDNVYNYGTFSFGPDFELQFMRGKLLYYLSYDPFPVFMQEYVEANRSVEEQILMLDGAKKQEIFDYLKNNALEENRYYKYDFFFDNCATRLRDVFPRSLDGGFKFGETAAAHERITYRQIINRYFYKTHWERFGVNLLLGSRIDKVMSNTDIMFLPDFLRDGIANATINNQKIATPVDVILPGSVKKPAGTNWAFVLTMGLCILTIAGLLYRPLKPLGDIMMFLQLFISGLLGCIILLMWFGTDHQGCQNNFNILWALPTNIFFAFAPKNRKGRYAIVSIVLLMLALVLHVLRVQEMPLLELSPMLLSLLCIYGYIYKKNSVSQA